MRIRCRVQAGAQFMITSILRQPLVQFFIIGGVFFALFSSVNEAPPEQDQERLEVSLQDARWLASQFQSTWNRPPSEEELARLIGEYVREEVYVREALALGLDRGDSVVRKRLRQKMEFVTEAAAQAAMPGDEELKTYFEENAETYATSTRISFSQIYLPDPSSETVTQVLDDLAAGADPQNLGQRTMLPFDTAMSPGSSIDGVFGSGFAQQLADLEPGRWSGPVTSGFGAHLVLVDAIAPEEIPPFEMVRDAVERDWRRDKARQLGAERFEELQRNYEVVTPDATQVLSE